MGAREPDERRWSSLQCTPLMFKAIDVLRDALSGHLGEVLGEAGAIARIEAAGLVLDLMGVGVGKRCTIEELTDGEIDELARRLGWRRDDALGWMRVDQH